MEGYTNDRVIAAIDAAPELVRDAVTSMQTAQAVAGIGNHYQLHVDIIGKLAQINRNMLIGLSSPTEAFGALVMLGIPAGTAKEILAELNRLIFLPLQERMRNPETPHQKPAPISTLSRDSASTPEPRPVPPPPSITITQAVKVADPEPIPAPESGGINLMEQGSVRPPAPAVKPLAAPEPPPPMSARPTTPIDHPGSAANALIRTMRQDMEHAQHPETTGMVAAPETSIGQAGMRYSPHPDHATPALFFQTGSIPVATPERAAPIVRQVEYAPTQAPVPPPIAPTGTGRTAAEQLLPGSVPVAPVPRPVPVNIDPATHDYAIDPYREPV